MIWTLSGPPCLCWWTCVLNKVQNRRCGDVTHFATNEPTVWFFMPQMAPLLTVWTAYEQSAKQWPELWAQPPVPQPTCNSQWRLLKLVSLGRENIVDWEKVVCLQENCMRSKLLAHNVRCRRQMSMLVSFWTPEFLGVRVEEIRCLWIKSATISDHQAEFRGSKLTGVWEQRSDFTENISEMANVLNQQSRQC